MTVRVRAPATTANVGPGFDCAAVALDLWNELEVGEGSGRPDRHHLGVQAFARISSPRGRSFHWTSHIPRARGLGSSAAVIAAGLVAGAIAEGIEPDPESLLAEGLVLEGHPDNLAAALAGGAVLTWDGQIRRIAESLPATPIALVPESRVSTTTSRAALPASVPHEDAAFTAARAALLGAAFASGSAELFAEALADRLHEPYRAGDAPLLGEVRQQPPAGALGATLSGSGPTVVVWAHPREAGGCAVELRRRFPTLEVLQLAVSPTGAGSF
jgi:homoserine kinase